MKYIIVVDNERKSCISLKGLLNTNNYEQEEFKIGAYYGFCDENGAINIDAQSNNLVFHANNILENKENSIHFMIDLLLTKEEEENATRLSNIFIDGTDEDIRIATGIQVANSILQELNNTNRIKISFMSRWLNLQSGTSMQIYNGIKNNPLWDGIEIKCVMKPINENNEITDLILSVPRYGVKSLVDIFIKVAFDDIKEDEKNE